MAYQNKYYLQVGENILSFPDDMFSVDMKDFLNLCLFTSLFEGEEELLAALHRLNVQGIPFTKTDIYIVKKTGNKQKGYGYQIVLDRVLYKKGLRFLSEGVIREFLQYNRNNYDVLSELFESYHADLTKLISIFQLKISKLKELLGTPTDDALKKEIELEIKNKQRSLNNFNYEIANIEAILKIISKPNTGSYFRSIELEYVERIHDFVKEETHYLRGANTTLNKRGLVRLTMKIAEIVERNPNLTLPEPTRAHSEMRKKILKDIEAIIKENRATPKSESDEDEIDPDKFIFYTEEDFESLYLSDGHRERTPEEEESIDLDIENLKDRKRKFGQ